MDRTARLTLLVAASAMALGCASGTPVGDDAGGFFRCANDTDCDDGAECTLDSCGIGNMCSFTALSELCPMGQTCVAGMGCVSGMPCTTNEQCQDTVACTVDSCGSDGFCRHQPIAARCTTPGMLTCDPVMGCIAGSGCRASAECDDSIACTADTCGADMTCAHAPINSECPSGQMCSTTRGCFTPMTCTTDAECQDGDFCNGREVCTTEFGCADAVAPRACADTGPAAACTVDSCDPTRAGTEDGMPTMGQCVFACDSTRAECGCGGPPDACSGTFALTGDTMYECLCLFGPCSQGYDFSQVTFANDGVVLTATPRLYWTTSTGLDRIERPLNLTDNDEPLCPQFDATISVAGDCREDYRLSGMFTGETTFTGTLERTYTGADCATYGCESGSFPVTGTRL